MAFSQDQITNAVKYFTGKNTARARLIANPSAGLNRAPMLSATPAAPTAGDLFENSPGYRDLPDWQKGMINASPSTWLTKEILAPRPSDEAPTNVAQWLIDLLGTGMYASAREGEAIGYTAAQLGQAIQSGDPGNEGWGNAAASSTGLLFGAPIARGIAEGFGARFDGERPRTWGQNFDDVGLSDTVRSGVAGIGGDQGWQDFAAGATGFAGDVLLDPLTYVGGLGLLKTIRGGAAGASAAVRAGEGVLKGTVEGASKARTVLRGEQAARAMNAAVRRGNEKAFLRAGGSTEAWEAFSRATRTTADDLVARSAKEAPADAQRVSEGAPATPAAADSAINPLAGIDELLPSIRGTIARDVPAAQILSDAARQIGTPKVAPDAVEAVRAVVANAETMPKFDAAMDGLKQAPDIATWLTTTPVQALGRTWTLDEAIEATVARRVSDAKPGQIRPLETAINAALREASTVARRTTPETLQEAIARHVATDALTESGTAIDDLMRTLASAGSKTARQQILKDTLGTTTRGYDSFDAALAGAVDGEVGAEMMREMLKALGVESRLTNPKALRRQLAGTGTFRWLEIKASVPTVREVLTDNGVAEATAAAAAVIDDIAPAVADAARASTTAAEYGFDLTDALRGVRPSLVDDMGRPTRGAYVGQAVHRGLERAGDTLKGVSASDSYGNKVAAAIHGGIIDVLKLRGGNVTELARGANFADDYLAATRIIEDQFRALGIIPRIPAGKARTPLYVSFGQIAENLPRDVLNSALFDLNYRLGKKVGDKKFEQGITIYPTTIMRGALASDRARAAGAGLDETVEIIRRAFASDASRNAFQRSPEGQAAVEDLAHAMADPAFQATMKSLSDTAEVIAVRIAERGAQDLLRPFTARLAQMVAKGADRGELTKMIDDTMREIDELTKGLDGAPTLVHDLARQRLDNGLVNGILGEWGVALQRQDARVVAGAADAAAKGTAGTRQAAGNHSADFLKDTEDLVARDIDEALANSYLEAVDGEAIRTVGEYSMELGQARLWGKPALLGSKVGLMAEGSYGQLTTFGARVMSERGMNRFASGYNEILGKWVKGTRGTPGLNRRIGAILGTGRATTEQVAGQLATMWRALAAHEKLAAGMPVGALHDALQRGLSVNAKLNIHEAIPALTREQADIAMELAEHLRTVFNPNWGPLQRSGLTAADINPFLERFGMRKFLLDDTAPLAAQTGRWADWSGVDDPLHILRGYMGAVSAAAIRPSFAGALKNTWGHQAAGLTAEQARASKDWVKFTSDGSLGRFIDKDTYFPREFRDELVFAQHALDELDKNLPTFWAALFKPVDAITGIIKPSMTIWRLGHHVTNILGNNLMLMMRGYNPLANLRTVRALRSLPGAPQLDESVLQAFVRSWDDDVARGMPGFTGPVDRSKLSQSVTVLTPGGQRIDLTPDQIATLAQQRGATMTPHQAKDLAPEREFGTLGGLWDRISHSPLNAISKINYKLSQGSAWYENITRLSVFMQALESRTFRNLDDALQYATLEVQKTHPMRELLSVSDRKYTTRFVLFHNWIRGAIGSVAEAALNRPALVALPSKWQYNQAEGAGFEPESIGIPFGEDPRIASYYRDGLLGPTWVGGLSPFGGTGDLEAGAEPNLWGYSLNSPQLDSLINYVGGFSIGSDPGRSARRWAGGLNPVFGMPIEFLSNKPLGIDTNKNISDNYGDWIWRNTGFPSSVTDAVGLTGTHPTWTPEENQGDVSRKAFNFLTGLKATNYTNPTGAGIAKSQQGQFDMAYLRSKGYTETEIKAIRAYWKAVRGTP